MNKRLAYVLLPAAVLVWGTIVYRIWQAVEADTEPTTVNVVHPVAATLVPTSRPPKLSLAYRDPFQVSNSARIDNPDTRSTAAPTIPTHARSLAMLPALPPAPPKSSPVSIVWPTVEFLGTIENKQNHRRIALLSISGQQTSLAEKQAAQGIKVLRVFKDSVQAEFQKQHRTFKTL